MKTKATKNKKRQHKATNTKTGANGLEEHTNENTRSDKHVNTEVDQQRWSASSGAGAPNLVGVEGEGRGRSPTCLPISPGGSEQELQLPPWIHRCWDLIGKRVV